MNKNITTALKEHSNSLDKIDIDKINTATELIKKSLASGNKVFWCGNGGSASQANHLSAELIGGMYKDKKALINQYVLMLIQHLFLLGQMTTLLTIFL